MRVRVETFKKCKHTAIYIRLDVPQAANESGLLVGVHAFLNQSTVGEYLTIQTRPRDRLAWKYQGLCVLRWPLVGAVDKYAKNT